MSNDEVSKLLSMLSKMDKKDLEEGFAKASAILKTKDSQNIIDNLKNNKM